MIVLSVCLLSDAFSQCLPSYLCFSYLGCGVFLHSCSSKVQLLLLTLDKVAPPDLEPGVDPLGIPAPGQPPLLGYVFMGLPGGTSGEKSTCQFRRCKRHGFNPWVRKIPGVENGNPLQYSCLGNPMGRLVGWATVHEVAKSRHD